MKEISIKISDIDCAACVERLNKALSSLEGIESASVNYATGRAKVYYDENKLSIRDIASKIRKTGYSVPFDTIEISFSFLNDERINEIKNLLKPIEEIYSIEEDRDTDSLLISLYPVYFESSKIVSLIKSEGIDCHLKSFTSADEEGLNSKRLHLIRLMAVGLFCTVPLLWDIHHTAQFVFSLIVQICCGAYFYKNAFRAIRNKSLTMDVLIAVSTTTIFLYSSYEAFFVPTQKKLYFMSGTALITLLLFGKYLELIAMNESANAIRKLMRLQCKSAVVERIDGEKEIPIDEIDAHDIIIVRAGDRIPVDGIILEGNLSLDESMISGESMPVEKGESDKVIGGTLCRDGYGKIAATALGKDSYLSQIIDIVQKAQSSKAPSARLADKIASYFVPAVLIIASFVFMFWYLVKDPGNLGKALYCVCSLLVIACPCALGLATPTAVMVGCGRAAQLGILFRGGAEIEKAHKVDTVVFDKTGTLTCGKMEITDIYFKDNADKEMCIISASSLERLSNHPISSAITTYAAYKYPNALPPIVEEFENIPGMGVKGKINGSEFLCGNRKLLERQNISLYDVPSYDGTAAEVCLVENNKLLCVIYISDTLRERSAETVKKLKSMNIDVFMISGDNEKVTSDIAKGCGIDKYFSSVLPDEKADIINKIRSEGHFVAMVGDGINDAPSLSSADLSVAMGSGTDIAIDCASVVLLGGRIENTPLAIEVSHQTLKTIRLNLLWSAFYNLVCIPAAALGIVNPAMASAAMSLSSNGVLLNSLRLQKAGETK